MTVFELITELMKFPAGFNVQISGLSNGHENRVDSEIEVVSESDGSVVSIFAFDDSIFPGEDE